MKFEDVEKARIALLEKQKQLRKKATMICVPIFVLLIIIMIVEIINNGKPGVFILASIMPLIVVGIIITVISAVIVGLMTNKETVAFRRAYKGYFVSRQLEKFFTDIKYDHEKGLDREILKDTGMIHTGDRYYSNDLVCAKYKNVNFIQADVTVQDEHTDSDGDTHYTTVFKGRYMIFEFPKKNSSRIMLSHYSGPVEGINKKTGRAMNLIETESTEFNKCYLTYAEDGVEAFYILTPDFMERAQELGRSHHDSVSIYFIDNKMIVGINDGGDIFEPPSSKEPINEKNEMEKTGKEIDLVIHIIDNLKLDRKVSK